MSTTVRILNSESREATTGFEPVIAVLQSPAAGDACYQTVPEQSSLFSRREGRSQPVPPLV
jgi:hypothetical protein